MRVAYPAPQSCSRGTAAVAPVGGCASVARRSGASRAVSLDDELERRVSPWPRREWLELLELLDLEELAEFDDDDEEVDG